MQDRPGSVVFGVIVGLVFAVWSYTWITDTQGRAIREKEERIVLASRDLVIDKLGLVGPEFVDPLAPQRRVGKVYVYPVDNGWEVSGFYRRNEDDRWHAYLISVDHDEQLSWLKVQDAAAELQVLASSDPSLEVLP